MQLLLPMRGNRWRIGSGPSSDVVVLDSVATLQRDGAARADALYVVIASLLKAAALTVGQLAQRADVRLETAVNFFNACCALGYLTTEISG